MTDARAAVGLDRLPWLADEPKARANSGAGGLLGWVVAAILLVAGVSYWLGMRSADQFTAPEPRMSTPRPATTVPLPQPRVAPVPQPQVLAEPAPEVEPVAPPPAPAIKEVARRAQPRAAPKRVASRPSASASKASTEETQEAAEPKAKAVRADPHQPWPVRVTDGASGRLVRIGTFTTPRQAKKAWWAIMKVNPALKRLPALVVPVQSQRNGRTYYRLQMGTTSQAHSEVLCQRMRIIGQSCVVIEVMNRGSEIAM